jgi:hypothetical protein
VLCTVYEEEAKHRGILSETNMLAHANNEGKHKKYNSLQTVDMLVSARKPE